MPLLRGPAVSAVALLTLLVAGCTAGERPPAEAGPTGGPSISAAPSPTPTTDPTPTPTPEPVAAPQPPAELARTDEVGAAAAAEYFLELYPYVLRTGDFRDWDRLSGPECGFCTDTKAYVERALAQGRYFEGGSVAASAIGVHPLDTALGGFPVDVDLVQEATTEFNSNGKAVSSTGEEHHQSRVDMLSSDEGWKVLAVSERSTP